MVRAVELDELAVALPPSPRLVLIAPPKEPPIPRLRAARAVVSMSCSRDVPWRIKTAAERLNRAGVPALYLEMPGCAHGHIAEGERFFDEAFRWLATAAQDAGRVSPGSP